MAAAKNKKSTAAKKTFDVTRPGKSAPPSSAKPVIVTNRPLLKDPMMVADAAPTETTDPAQKPSPVAATKKITVQAHDAEPADDSPAKSAPLMSGKGSSKVIAPTLPVDEPEKPAAPVPDVSEGTSAKTDAQASAESAAEPSADEPPSGGKTPEPAQAAPASADTSNETNEPSSPKATAGSSADQPAQSGLPAAKQSDKEAAAEQAAKEAEAHRAEVQKLADSRKYFLSINSVEKRKTKRHVVLGALLIIILAVAWADISLDAGIIHLGNLKAFTHFFSN